MKCQYVVVAESFSLDHATGRLSAFHLLDNIKITSVPFLIPSMVMIGFFHKEANDGNLEPCIIEVLNNSNVLISEEQNIILESPANTNRFFSLIQGLIINEAGVLQFNVKTKGGKRLGYWDVNLTYPERPTIKTAISERKGIPNTSARPKRARAASKPSKS